MNALSDAALRRLRDAADAPDLTGTKYEIVERIGQGGMGTVRVIASWAGKSPSRSCDCPRARRTLPPA